jgi:ATP-dependent DNA helicase RecG
MKPAIDQWSPHLEEFLPVDLKDGLRLSGLAEAINQAHYPENELKHNEARRRLAFDELFLLQLGVLNKKRNWQQGQPGAALTSIAEINTFRCFAISSPRPNKKPREI